MTEAERAVALDEYINRRLLICERAWRDGSTVALQDAVSVCRQYRRALPDWASEAISAALGAAQKGGVKRRRGERTPATAHRENIKHYARWDAVREIRDRLDELADIASTWEETYGAAADILAGTAAAGSAETMKASYQLVEATMRAGKAAGRFYLPMRRRPLG